MMFPRFGRKRQRLSGGSYRGPQQPPMTQHDKHIRRLVLLVSFAFLVVAITQRLSPSTDTEAYNLEGIIAQDTFIAEIGFKSEDLQKTREAREAAAAKVPDVFRVDEAVIEEKVALLQKAVDAILAERPAVEAAVREALAAAEPEQTPATVISRTARAYAEELVKRGEPFQSIGDAEALAVWLTPRLQTTPAVHASTPATSEGTPKTPEPEKAPALLFTYSEHLATLARQGLLDVLEDGILKEGERGSEFSKDPERRIMIIRGDYQEDEIPLTDAHTMENATEALKTRLAEIAQDSPSSLHVPAGEAPVDLVKLQDAALAVASIYLADTLRFDSDETNVAREIARNHVEPVMKEIMPTEEIQRRGQRWSQQSRSDVRTYLDEKQRYDKQTANVLGALAGHMVLVCLLMFGLVKSLPLLVSKRQFALRDLNLVLLIMCATVGIGRIVLYFDDSGLLVPAAAGGILIAILTNTRVATLSSALIAILLSIQYDYSWRVLVVLSVMSFTGVLSIFMVRKRSDMGGASVKATVIGLLAVIGMALAQDSLRTEGSVNALASVALNGLVCLLIVPGLLSPLERLFGITTDIQLLEYSDLNNHILSRLAMEVPATYAHSLMLGQLAEAAADAIGANGLLARVCAYYHDIGKIRRPEYFVENQTGANIHDELSPRLSARAIASHVTEGAEMARSLHLPKPLVDAIYEHHGTCLISFFYKEAVAQQKHGGVIEADFRYPGPRPRSRETAILMICDAVESGVRTLRNPNEERVREFIDRIISSRASDRQFDECDLTLRDLDTIAEVLAKRIASSQHKRIAYPEPEKEKQAKVANALPMPGGQEQ
ncbi:MAG: HDIG domain-containing protein [Candidatus Hydrogenedentes bacterium]|nr:HDIG domain-containing protein [Candidatus Hydrogenedentota bacterium]